MRQLFSVCVLLFCGLAWGQNEWVPPGTYAQPSALRVATPSASPEALATPFLTLDSPALAAGASISGANSATASSAHFNRPLWYAPGTQYNWPSSESPASAAPTQVGSRAATAGAPHGFEFGAATFQSSYGAAQLAANRSRQKAGRVYTNPDVARLSDATGIIKYGGKVEHLN